MTENWKKSTYTSHTGECVEVRYAGGVHVRDTKDRGRGHFTVGAQAWTVFVAQLGVQA